MDRRFNGLVNHGATCYLNTLLQALFWTPDFRSMIYNWYSTSDASGNDENDITYQLNNLFRDLEKGEEPANPNKVIKCLGINNTCKQEDIATYFRLLMKKISNIQGLGEKVLQLFESEQVCVVKCNECQHEDKKTTKLLQISVPIQLTGSKHFSSVAESLQTFQVEALCDENQIYCGKCEKKCDAEIQYYLKSLPEVLVLQLKRFCFDSRSDSYVKDDAPILITEKLEFECGERGMHVKLQKGVREWCMVLSKCGRSCILFTISIILGFIRPIQQFHCFWRFIFPLLYCGRSCILFTISIILRFIRPIQHCQGFRRFIYPLLNCGRSCILFTINNILRFIWPIQNKTSSLNDTNPQTEEEATQNTVKYELFAVCHHFGGCNGGHYQAKIKIFTDNQWYIFDDNRVQKVGSSVDKDERTAYLLMYLKVDPHTCQEYLRHDIISKYKAEKRKDHEDDERITGKKRNKIDCHQSNKGRCDNSTVAKYEDIESNIVLPKNGEISVVCNRPDSYCYLSKEQNNDHKTDTYIQNSHSQEGLQSNGYQDFSDQSRHQVDHEKIAEGEAGQFAITVNEEEKLTSGAPENDKSSIMQNGDASNRDSSENENNDPSSVLKLHSPAVIICKGQQNGNEQSPHQSNEKEIAGIRDHQHEF